MNWQRIFFPVAGTAIVALAWQQYGWPGVGVAVTGIVMWMLLHFSRLMHILRQASARPVGYVASAVMLNAKLRPGVTLMHVMAMTRSLGELMSAADTQPEVYRWTDNSASSVTCDFAGGKLVKWELQRPVAETDPSAAAPAASTGS